MQNSLAGSTTDLSKTKHHKAQSLDKAENKDESKEVNFDRAQIGKNIFLKKDLENFKIN